jgi:hypothetical protein
MRRWLLGILAFLALGQVARAQFTTVSATVKDPSSNLYVSCRGNIDFVPSPTATQVPLLSGSTFQTSVPIASCDSFANFTAVLADNLVVSDGHTGATASAWKFSICSSGTPPVCFNAVLTITGATQNITAALQAVSAPLPGSVVTSSTNLQGPGFIAGTFSGTHTETGVVTFSNASSTFAGNAATATSATTSTAATNATNLVGPGTATGNYTHSGTETFAQLNGCQGVNALQTLPQAIAAVSNPGCILVSINYALAASAVVPSGVTLGFQGNGGITTTGFTLTVNGPIIAPPVQIFFGTGTLALGGLANPLHAVWFPGADILAQIGNAYAASSTTFATILVDPQSTGACWVATSTANLNVAGKAAIVQGTVPPMVSSANVVTGSCIDYTPTTATSAFELDWTPTTGGEFPTGAGIRDLALINGTTFTNGGSGSLATGFYIGRNNAGTRKGLYSNVTVMGFGNNFVKADNSGLGWGILWFHDSISHGNVGINYSLITSAGSENDTIQDSNLIVNGTGVKFNDNGLGGSLTIIGGSVDANTVCGINLGSGTSLAILNSTGVHYENNGTANVQYVCSGSLSSQVFLTGGDILDDTSGGSTAQSFFSFGHGSMMGFTFAAGSGGRTYSSLPFNIGSYGRVDIINTATTAFPTLASLVNTFTTRVTETKSGTTGRDSLAQLYINNANGTQTLLISNAAPTIAAGGCGGSAASISNNNGTGAFWINTGTAPTAAGCTVTLPTASAGWNCFVTDITTNSTSVFLQKQTGGSTTTAILQNFSDVAVATAPTANDIYRVSCHAD